MTRPQETRQSGALAQAVPLRVLVVDDSKLQRRILRASCQRMGCEVEEACDGREALSLLKRERFEIVLSDWMMPGLTGPELCREIRDLPGSDYVYFILQTSRAEKDSVAEGLDAGADDFLTKPVNAAELRARMRAGERLLDMQRELSRRNTEVEAAYARIKTLYDSLERDLEEAKKLQLSLIPRTHCRFGRDEAALHLRSSGHVGGDLVGCVELPGGCAGLFGIDVSGHGVSSALLTARVAGMFNASTPDACLLLERTGAGAFRPRAPRSVAEALNNRLLEEMSTDLYLTLFYAVVDPGTGEARAVQAGHPHPIVLSAHGETRLIGDGGPPVGLIAGIGFEDIRFSLAPGDRLFVYSDGVTECCNEEGVQLGEEGLARMVRAFNHFAPRDLAAAIEAQLLDHAADPDLEDDVSMLVYDHARRRD